MLFILQFRKNASGDIELITQNIPGIEPMDQNLPATVISDVQVFMTLRDIKIISSVS